MDRVAPTRRPNARVVGHQKWRQLLFMHWAVPPEAITPHLPKRLTLDLHDGIAWVGVVPFVMRDIAPWWLPGAFALNFLETNLRTYVHLDGENPGVHFFSLEASSQLAVWAARVGFGLPYFHARMSLSERDGLVEYRTTRRGQPAARHHVRYRLGELLGPSQPGSLEHFLLERYLLYAQRGDALWRGQVHHAPYPAQRAEVVDVEDGLLGAAGLPPATGKPALVHYAHGVDVEVFDLMRVA